MSSFYYDNCAEAVQVQELANLLARLSNEDTKSSESTAEYKRLVESNKLSLCMNKLATESDVVFEKGSDAETVSFFALFGTLSLKLGAQRAEVDELMSGVITKIIQSTERKQLRLQILSDLFNLDSSIKRRFRILHAVFKYATETDQTDAILQSINNIDKWAVELQLDKIQVRELIAAVLPGLDSSTIEACDLAIKFLETFSSEETLGEYEEFFQKRLVDFVKYKNNDALPFEEISTCNVLSSLNGKPAYEIFCIFTNGSCKQFKEFAANNSAFLVQEGLDTDTCLTKLRQAALISICSNKHVVNYSEISSILDVPEEEVEGIVIDAVMQGFVDVRLNQPEKTVIVRYARQPTYTATEWKELGRRVEVFKANVIDLMQTLRANRDGVVGESH